MKKSVIVLILTCLALSSIILASYSQENAILGKWQEINGKETLEFFSDGTVSWVSLSGITKGDANAAKYEFIDSSHIKLSIGGMAEAQEFSILGDGLTLTDPRGVTKEYQRLSDTSAISQPSPTSTNFINSWFPKQ